MSRDVTIAVVGVSDETTAHLRLLMRQAAGKLARRWRWGSENDADLVVVDTANFTGQMGRTRAISGGIRCATVNDAEHRAEPDELVLHRPLRIANVIDVLNRAAVADVATGDVQHQGVDFYAESDDAAQAVARFDAAADAASPGPVHRSRTQVAMGLDELIRGDPLAEPPSEEKRRLLPPDVTITAGGGASARGQARFNDTSSTLRRSDPHLDPMRRSDPRMDALRRSDPRMDALRRSDPRMDAIPGQSQRLPGVDSSPSAPPADKAGAAIPRMTQLPGSPPKLGVADTAPRNIDSYLVGEALGGPSLTRIAGAPALALDPKQRVFHAAGSLSELQAYCTTSLAPGGWRPLTNTELNALREREPARPYEHLAWLGALLRSTGRLQPHLDPGGTYRLKKHVQVEAEFHAHGPIAHAMLRPSRLHEIAQNSTATMDQVFDIVNAYDAIGYLEWTPRPSRYAQPAESKGSALLSRLKSKFTR